ncbi:metallophosphoesterase [Candidatus Bipolaricaulota bacterium]|nr:metallophosphoesterase [Candidatus Bipolaricaulota bacterium]
MVQSRWLTFLITGVSLFVLFVAALAEEPNSPDVTRIGIFADLHAHDADSPLEGKTMTNYPQRLSAFVEAMNAWPADFVIELGDFVNGWVVLGANLGDPYRIPQILEEAEAIYARFDGPRYHVIGNHDVYNLSKEEYLERVNITSTYYSFNAGAYHFVVLDVQYDEEGNDLAYTYTGVRGFLPQVELDWLREDLSSTDDPTIVCVHQMLDTEPTQAGWTLIGNNKEVQGVLAESGVVIAVFQGHDHANRYSLIDGIHYITFEALVDEGAPPSWAKVTLDQVSRTIEIEGEGDQAYWHLEY